MKHVGELAKSIKKEILAEIKGPGSPRAGPSTHRRSGSRERDDDPLRVGPPRRPGRGRDW